MGTPCRIIPNAEIAKRLGLKENQSISFAEWALKIHEGVLDDFDMGGKPPIVEGIEEETKEPKYEGFRNEVFGETQKRFKTSPLSFQTMVADGLSKLKIKQGQTIFDATKKVAKDFLDKLNSGNSIVMDTAETAQMQYYLTSLRSMQYDLLEKGIEENMEAMAMLKLDIEDAEAIFGAAGQEQARAFAMRQLEAAVPMDKQIKVRRAAIFSSKGIKESDVSAKELDLLNNDLRKELELSEANYKKLEQEYEAKLKEQAEKHITQLAEARKKTKQAGITEEAKAKRAYAKRALDVLDQLEKKLKGKTYSDVTGATSLAITGIRLIKTGIKAGLKIEEAIDNAIKTLNKTYKNWKEDEFRKDMLDGFSGIEQEEGKIDNGMLRDVVESLVDEGKDVEEITIDDIIGRLKEDYFGDKTDDEIRDLITGYGTTKETTKDAVDTTISYAKTIGRLISQIKDAEGGTRPKKATETIKEESEEAQKERQAKISGLRKQLNEALKNIPIDEETRQNQLKTSQDRIKTFLENSIKDLEEQIAKGEKKPAKKTVEYNEANKALRKQRDELRAQLNKLVANDNIPLEEKIRRAVKGIETSERNWERRTKEGKWENTKKEPLSDPRIEEAKAKRDARKAEFDRLKKENVPPIDKKAKLKGDITDLAIKQNATTLTNEMVKKGYVAELVRQKIEEGYRGSDVYEQIQNDLKDVLPNITIKDIHEAVLKEGVYKQESKKVVEDTNKKLEGEVRQIAALQKQIADLLQFGIKSKEKSTPKEVSEEVQLLKKTKQSTLQSQKEEAASLQKDIDALKKADNIFKERNKKLLEAQEKERLAKLDALKSELKKAQYEREKARVKELRDEVNSHLKRMEDLRNKINKKKEKVEEINKKIAAIDGRLELWEQKLKDPQKIDERLKEKRKQLRDALVRNGKTIENEKLTNKVKLDTIINGVNEKLNNLREKYTSDEATQLLKSLGNIVTGTVEKRSELIRRKVKEIEMMAEMAKVNNPELSSDLYSLLKDIKDQEELFKTEKATENFIKSTERIIDRNRRDLKAERFGDTLRGNPLINDVTIKLGIEKKRSERALRIAEERFVKRNEALGNKITQGYLDVYRNFLISGLKPIQKIGVAGLLRTVAETLRRSLYVVLGKTLLRNIGIARGEGISLKSTLKAHGGLTKLFQNEAKVAEMKKEASDKFEQAKANYESDKSDINKKLLDEAAQEYAFSTIYDFVTANSLVELGQAIAGVKTKMQEYFAMDKGLTADELETKQERIAHYFDTLGRLHGALKNSLSGRAEVMRSFMLDIEQGMKLGEDVTAPENITMYSYRAMLANKDATYQNDNALISQINKAVQDLTKNKSKYGIVASAQNALAQFYFKIAYPIVKTPMNIYAEGVYQYTLGVLFAAGFHLKETTKNYKEISNILQDASFREKWSQVAENMSKLDESKKREIGMLYTKGGVGAMIMAMTLAGLIKKDEDDEWEFFGVHFGKKMSSAISHFSLLMPPMYMAEFLHASEKQEKKNEKNPDEYKSPFAAGGAAMLKRAKEENVYLREGMVSSQERVISNFIPSFGLVGDAVKMGLDYDYDPKTVAEFEKVAWGTAYLTKDVPIKKKIEIKDEEIKKKLNKVGFEIPIMKMRDYETTTNKPVPYEKQEKFLSKLSSDVQTRLGNTNLRNIDLLAEKYANKLKQEVGEITDVEVKNLKEQFIKNKIKSLYDDLVTEIADEYNIKPKKVKDLDEKERQKIISEIKEEFNKKP